MGSTKTKKKVGKKAEFAYQPLEKGEERNSKGALSTVVGYSGEAYETFCSIRWDKAWEQFLSLDEDGVFKYKTAGELAKFLAKGVDSSETKKRANWLHKSIGQKSVSDKELVPYLGDWEYMRSSLFIGEVQKESLLFGSPKMSAVRELVKKHLDVMEISQALGEIMIGWLARYENWSTQVDEYFGYKLFDPTLSDKANDIRFKRYTRKMEYLFSRTIDACTETLRCFGVGKDDISLLTQMMVASMKGKLGEGTANMMMAAASGLPANRLLPADNQPLTEQERIKPLDLMLKSFLVKSHVYKLEQPGMEIEGIPPEDTRTDPAKDPPKQKTNGHGRVKPN